MASRRSASAAGPAAELRAGWLAEVCGILGLSVLGERRSSCNHEGQALDLPCHPGHPTARVAVADQLVDAMDTRFCSASAKDVFAT